MREAMPLLKQCQLVQQTAQQIEVRLAVDESDRGDNSTAARKAQEVKLGKVICEALGYPFEISFQYQTGALEKTRSGKFEEVVCNVL